MLCAARVNYMRDFAILVQLSSVKLRLMMHCSFCGRFKCNILQVVGKSRILEAPLRLIY